MQDDSRAFVTLQDANGVAILDLSSNEFTEVIGLGAKDFSLPGNEIDPKDNDGKVEFITANARGLYMPDAVASYRWRGRTYLVLANEGDFREDNADRSAAGSAPYFAAAPLDRLRISNRDSSPGNLYAAGARSMSIRDAEGTVVYDSGSILDTEAHERGVYDDGRSRDKGVEPEGVALLEMAGRTYAFVGLERTTSSTVAVFDITTPYDVKFLDMIVTPGDLSRKDWRCSSIAAMPTWRSPMRLPHLARRPPTPRSTEWTERSTEPARRHGLLDSAERGGSRSQTARTSIRMMRTAAPASRRYPWLVVALLVPVALLNYLDRQMLASMKFSVMRDIPDIGLEANWGVMLALFKWVYAFLSPIGGYIADRFSRRYVIAGSLFVWSAVTWATGHVDELRRAAAGPAR